MGDGPMQLIVAAFKDEAAAKEAVKILKQAQKENRVRIDSAAILHKDAKGKLHIKETADLGGRKGAALGGVAGAAIGLIAGPALLVPAAVGALVGGLAARLRGSGFSDARLEMLGEGLRPDSFAIVAVVERTWDAPVKAAITQAQGDLLTASISADISRQLESDHDVAYMAITSEQGLEVARMAGGVDQAEVDRMQVDDSAVHGSRFVATKDGFAVVPTGAPDEE